VNKFIKWFLGISKENSKKEILGLCFRCREITLCRDIRLDKETVLMCPYCTEHVKKHGKVIPPVSRRVKDRLCKKCSKRLWPHESFYYMQDWEDISKSQGYFCGECVSPIDSTGKKIVWTAAKVYEHIIDADEEVL
jgi:hypothetical protein